MSKTISNIQTAQYDLVSSGNPLTITSSGGVETPGAVAITGTTTQAWTVANAGTVIGSYGIELEKGGLVTNTGSIIVTYEAVQISGARGTVSNSGKILGGFDGVVLFDGGTVTNLAAGTIGGNGNIGVYLSGAAATLTNAGTIIGSADAVAVVGGITSRIVVDPGAVFVGKVQGGSGSNTLELATGNGAAGTLGGIGTQFAGFGTIAVDAGATWSLINSGTLSGVSSLINHGTLAGSGTIDARSLFNDGTIAAAANLTVGVSLVNQGSIATTVTLAAGATFDNGGAIIKTRNAVYGVGGPSSVINSGTLVAYDVIYLAHGGAVTNLSGGMIASDSSSADGGDGVNIKNASGTVTNSGTIMGANVAIYLNHGGTVTNLSVGLLQGGRFSEFANGVYIIGGSGTITNAGTIFGGDHAYAVAFSGNFTDRLIVDPGAVFTGGAHGGGGSNTLELASGTSGNAGTITGFTQYSGFGTIDIDLGAAWSLVNAGTLASGTTLTDSGTLTSAGSLAEVGSLIVTGGPGGLSVGAGGVLINAGTLGLTGMLELQAGGAARGGPSAGVAASATNSGTLTNAGTVLLDGGVGGGDSNPGGPGGVLTNAGLLINSALISLGGGGGGYANGLSGLGGTLSDSGTLTNAGTIRLAGGGSKDPSGLAGGYGAGLVVGGTLVNSGSIGIAAGDTGGAGPGYAAVLTVNGTATLSGAGIVNGGGSLVNHGSILASVGIAVSYLFNDGTIGSSAQLTDTRTLVNKGGIASGVTLAADATLYNAATVTDASGSYAVTGYYAQDAVTNTGTLTGSGGVNLRLGGAVTNTGGTITGTSSFGVYIGHGDGAVTNDGGRILGVNLGVDLGDGGMISNLSGGVLLAARYGAYIGGGIGTIINAGTITGFSAAVLDSGGTISNASGALLDGTAGVGAEIIQASGTIINAGTIIGNTSHQAVSFGGNFTDRLVVDPGAVFVGRVQGGDGSNTLELAPGSGGNNGTISGIGTQFIGFGSLAVDAGADWVFDASDTLASATTIGDAGEMLFNEASGRTVAVAASLSGSGGVVQSGPGRLMLTGNDSFTGGVTLTGGTLELSSGNAAGAHGITFAGAGIVRFGGLPTGTIHGFASTDTIDLPSYSYVSGAQATLAAGNTLIVETGAHTFDLLLDPTQNFAGHLFSVHQDAATGVLVEQSAPCFARGTHLLTAQGKVAIEALRIGDLVMTAAGALRPVRWIGRRGYAGRSVGGNRDILPICIRAGALADGVPCRDLQVSPKHAMFLDGLLIPAERLVNGVSIVQPEHVDALTYYHVELDSHDILIAEGAPSESFIDHDSRLMFDNAAEFSRLLPAHREDCAPRVEDGEALERVRQRIAARTGLYADHADDAAMDGPLDGRIDMLDEHEIAGWAFDVMRPHTPVQLDILDGDRVIGTAVANRFRPDLRPAGKGDGRCAYVFRFDTAPADLRGISLRRSSDGAMLPAPATVLRAA